MTDASTWTVTPLSQREEGLPEAWRRLNERRFNEHPLLHPLFLEPLLRHFGRSNVHLARMEMSGEVCGLALIRRHRMGRWSLFQPSQAPLGPIMLEPGNVAPLDAVSQLIRCLPGPALQFDLTFLDPAYSPMPEESPVTERIQHAVTMGLEISGSFEDYWSSRKKQLRTNMRGYLRRLDKDGIDPVWEVITDPDAMDAAVNAYGDLESAGWKGREGTAIHRSNTQGQAYREIMRGFAERGQAIVHRLMINDRLAACWLIIQAGGMSVMLKTTFDEALAEYALGRVHLYHTLKYLWERGDSRVIEFYTNANPVQLQWGNISRPIFHLTYYRNSLVLQARRTVRSLLSPIRGRQRR